MDVLTAIQVGSKLYCNDRLILRQFCLSGIESIQNIVSAEKKKWERENRVSHKKSEKKKRLMTLELKKHTLMMTTVVAHKYVDQRSWKTGILERYLPGDSSRLHREHVGGIDAVSHVRVVALVRTVRAILILTEFRAAKIRWTRLSVALSCALQFTLSAQQQRIWWVEAPKKST